MKLTRVERWILSNQFQILKALHPEEAKDWQNAAEAVESGYELEFESLATHIYENGLNEADCRQVIHIMSMFSTLKHCYSQLSDKSGIDAHKLAFEGFSGNEETLHMAYARWLYANHKFRDLKTSDDFNSHSPSLPSSRRMLRVWESMNKKYDLTREEIIQITSA